MVIHYFTLAALSREFNERLRGASIAECFTQHRNELIVAFRLSPEEELLALCVSVEPKFNFAYLRSGIFRARKNTREIFPSMAGSAVTGVHMEPFDRVMLFRLSDDRTLTLRLFNTVDSNVLLVGRDDTIVEAFKNNKSLAGMAVSHGRSPVHPDFLMNDSSFSDLVFSHPDLTLLALLKRALPWYGAVVLQEALFRCGIVPTVCARTIGEPDMRSLRNELNALAHESPTPGIYKKEGSEDIVSALILKSLDTYQRIGVASINEAIRTLVSARYKVQRSTPAGNPWLAALDEELDRSRRSIEAVEQQVRSSERSDEYELTGKALLANLHLVAKGMKGIDVPRPDEPDRTMRVQLDPALAPTANAKRYFDRARKSRATREENSRRLAQLREREEQLVRLREELERVGGDDSTDPEFEKHKLELKSLNIMTREEKEDAPPFRTFTVPGGFEVWVGRNSANNDLLTMKYSKPHDLWFHVRGAGGSHTILRVPGKGSAVPKEAVRAAASIAAYYSKMRKAGNVPVAYCERKYVRKPKNAAQGAVNLEREEVVFVRPRLPAGSPAE